MRYYETYIHKVRLREFLRMNYPRQVTPACTWLMMQLGLVRWPPMITPREEWQKDLPITLAECEEPVRSSLADGLRQAEACGFVEPTYYCYRTRGYGNLPMIAGCLKARHTSGNFIVQVVHVAPGGTPGVQSLSIVSYTAEGGVIATANNRRTFDSLACVEATYYPGVTLAALLAHHQRRLQNCMSRLVPIRTNADMAREQEQVSEQLFDNFTARGIMREVPGPA